jgi:hypothetical protein
MKVNRATVKTHDTSLMAGTDKHIAASITIDAAPYTPAE